MGDFNAPSGEEEADAANWAFLHYMCLAHGLVIQADRFCQSPEKRVTYNAPGVSRSPEFSID
eukprot:13964295-Alexandrium_andersonii.AAC.1